jgi:glycosyltransferase involved in cell wall biosynthesis
MGTGTFMNLSAAPSLAETETRFQSSANTLRPLHEIITGRPRPRHLRFAAAIAELAPGTVLERRDHSLMQRLRTNAVCRLSGVREVDVSDVENPLLLHQALTTSRSPYAAEFDVPLALHGYSYGGYLRYGDRARRLLEQPSLKILFVFSDWARRSFALHYGEAVDAKCRISYPLASMRSDASRNERRYDFAFIASGFRVKGGPELLRAFKAVRHSGAPNATMCVVTDLDEAKKSVGDLSAYAGVEWRSANLNEEAIAALLSETHCLVHPTMWDSFGVVVLEALAAGCAIIASDLASISEVVTKESGILLKLPIGQVVGDMTVPQFSIVRDFAELLDQMSLHAFERDLTAAMATMGTDTACRLKYREGARELYRRRFSLAAWKESMLANLKAGFPDLDVQ